MCRVTTVSLILAVFAVLVPAANAQRGVGEKTGIAQQAVRPNLELISGRLIDVVVGPCEATTGHAQVGSHIILETAKKKQVNVHLGPSGAVKHVTDQLQKGQRITVRAFRTQKMTPNHYVAQALELENDVLPLRDEQLRPVWAGGSRQMGPNRGTWTRGNRRGGWGGRRRGWGRGAADGQQATPGACPWR